MQGSTERAAKPYRRAIVRGLAIVLGMALLFAARVNFFGWYFGGFPDGYVSPYERDMLGLHLVVRF